jgi:hypothetical protein
VLNLVKLTRWASSCVINYLAMLIFYFKYEKKIRLV